MKKSKELTKNRTPIYHVEPETMSSVDQSLLPIDPDSKKPIAPTAQPGYYPDYHTLSQQNYWDEATRKVILKRVQQVPSIRFFTPDEALFMKAVCDRLLPQDDRDAAHKIPIVHYIDERLYEKRGDRYRFEDMPPDDEAIGSACRPSMPSRSTSIQLPLSSLIPLLRIPFSRLFMMATPGWTGDLAEDVGSSLLGIDYAGYRSGVLCASLRLG